MDEITLPQPTSRINWGWAKFLSLADLNDLTKGYLVNDKIVIEACMSTHSWIPTPNRCPPFPLVCKGEVNLPLSHTPKQESYFNMIGFTHPKICRNVLHVHVSVSEQHLQNNKWVRVW